MSYVVTIFTEKHLYRVNIEEGTKYTIGSGEKDAFPMSELGVDGQLGICFHAKKQILKLNAKKINRHSPYLSITLHKCYPYYLFGISTFPSSVYHSIALRKFSITIV